MLTLQVKEQIIENLTPDEKFIRGTVGAKCQIKFDEFWSKYEKTVVFQRKCQKPINIIVNELDNEIEIPYEILEKHGKFKIGVFGIIENEVLPTLWSTDIEILCGTDTHGTNPQTYTPSEIDQLRLSKQDKLTAGDNITIDENNVISASGGGTTDYALLENKPQINGVELLGNKSLTDLGIDIPTKTSELENDSGFIDDTEFENYYTKTEVDEKTVVDQTYNKNSQNAQSGIAVAEALSGYVMAEVGKGLSSNDFTNEDKEKLYSALQNEDIDQTYSPTSANAQSGKAVAEAIAPLSEQISNNNAELADIRVGADGRIYSNAGEAVRGQISELNGDLTNKLPKSPNNWEAWTVEEQAVAREKMGIDGTDGKSAYQIAVEHGYTGTESEWLASLHAANPKVLLMSQYATEAEAIAYMDSQTDHSIIYVWNNKVYCYASKTVTQITGACLYGYRNSASSGIVAADGKSMYVIPVSSFATPLTISDYTFPISSTPHIYGGTVIPTFNKALIQNDSWVGKTDAFDISAEQLQGCSYVVFAVTTSTQPSEASVTVNGTVVPLSVITSPSQISEVVGTGTTTVDGYVDSGVIYTAIISSSSTEKYVNDRNSYILPVPSGYCESHATYEAGTHYLTKYPYETMTGMFSALATANTTYITETTLGKDQSNTYDIKSYILDAPSSLASGQTSSVSSEKPVFIITAGLHGLEPDAVHTVYHFMQDLAENFFESEQLQYLHNNIKFVIIPICNPWGYVNQNYNNSRDVDLNKNFESGYRTNGTANTGTAANSEAETLLMKQVFDVYPKAIFHLECHGKYGVDTAFSQTIWFSLMKTLASELIELNANKLNSQIGKRLYNLGYSTNKSTGGYITYFGLNGRPKDYTGTKYGILSGTMEGTGCIYSDTGYSVNTQKINCEALENFVLNVIDSLGSKVKVRNTDNEDTIASLDWYNGEVM